MAVIGAGHVPGIRKYWGEDIDVEKLLEIPPLISVPLHLKLLVGAGAVGITAAAVALSCAVVVGGGWAASFAGRLLGMGAKRH